MSSAAGPPAQQFWIVRHGIKYAGMPAWVALGREDEVWSVVVFLQALPGTDAPTYRRLAFGQVTAATEEAAEGLRLLLLNGPTGNGLAACARCHGAGGGGGGDPNGAFPRLQGQTVEYLYGALQSYALAARPSGIMQPVAAELGDAEMRVLAEHYAAQPMPAGPAVAGEMPAETLALGRRIAQEGLPGRGVAACGACHGPKTGPVPALYPRLEGQYEGYIATQLGLWMSGVRGGRREKPEGAMMARAVGMNPDQPGHQPSMRPEEIRAVAACYARQPRPAPQGAVAER